MHQHAASPHAYPYGVQDVFQLLRRDRSRVRDWNLDVDGLRCPRNSLLAAKRNHGRDTPRIRTRQLHRIFETPDIESFPNLCHWPPTLVDTSMPIVLPPYPIRIQEANVVILRQCDIYANTIDVRAILTLNHTRIKIARSAKALGVK